MEQSESIAMISQAQTPQDLKNGVDSLLQELGEEKFTALTQAFQQSKSQNIKMAKKGTKIDYLVDKLAAGNQIPDKSRQRKIDQRNIDLTEKIFQTANIPSTVSVEVNPNVRTAKSGDDTYTLQTSGRDSMM